MRKIVHITIIPQTQEKLLTTKAIPTNGFIYIMHTKPNADFYNDRENHFQFVTCMSLIPEFNLSIEGVGLRWDNTSYYWWDNTR